MLSSWALGPACQGTWPSPQAAAAASPCFNRSHRRSWQRRSRRLLPLTWTKMILRLFRWEMLQVAKLRPLVVHVRFARFYQTVAASCCDCIFIHGAASENIVWQEPFQLRSEKQASSYQEWAPHVHNRCCEFDSEACKRSQELFKRRALPHIFHCTSTTQHPRALSKAAARDGARPQITYISKQLPGCSCFSYT